jgi:hypothetical protein
VTVWANVDGDGTVAAGQGLSVQEVSTGAYQVTVTDSTCAHETNAPVVTVSDSAPGSVPGGAFPVAWYEEAGGNQQFTVYTGVVPSSGPVAVNPTSLTFDIIDTCG